MPEETKERYRRWWSNRTVEDRARLRALNGQPVTPHELLFLDDPEGFLLTARPGEASDSAGVFSLPDFLSLEQDQNDG